MRLLLLAALLAAPAAAAPLPKVEAPERETASRVVFRGKTPSAAELRSLVSVEFAAAGKKPFTCSGVLISSNVAATTAHCWDEGFAPRAAILHGADGARRPVLTGARHEAYDEDEDPEHAVDDIGFVVIGGELPGGAGPADLLKDPSGVKPGDALILVGTGLVEEGARRGPRRAELSIERVYASTLTAGDGGRSGACRGDSGGPGFVEKGGRLAAAALVSSGPATNCRTAGTTTFVFIPPYRAWLLSAAKTVQDRLSAKK